VQPINQEVRPNPSRHGFGRSLWRISGNRFSGVNPAIFESKFRIHSHGISKISHAEYQLEKSFKILRIPIQDETFHNLKLQPAKWSNNESLHSISK